MRIQGSQPGLATAPRTLPDFDVLTRQPLRWMSPWAIICVLWGVALSIWSTLPARVDVLGLLQAPWMSIKMEVTIHRAVHGTGPDDSDLAPFQATGELGANGKSRPALLPSEANLHLDDGSFDLKLAGLGAPSARRRASEGHVSWLLNQVDGAATLTWTCGYATPPGAGQLPAPRNLTDVAPELLPAVCRPTP